MNLYVHFPFCRRRCTYCSLYSRTGVAEAGRNRYAEARAREIAALDHLFDTVYFGGGSPASAELSPVFAALRNKLAPGAEFTVELHPLDVTETLLAQLAEGGVNRISMGVQSLEDSTLAAMGRGYTVQAARAAYELIRRRFDNAGIDLIVGYPGSDSSGLAALGDWQLKHCSVYALQNERGLKGVKDDEALMDELARAAESVEALGLERYEISNYAVRGYECRHNLAVWRGEDYLGLGEGAAGREGRIRTRGVRGGKGEVEYRREEVPAELDRKERVLFRLRTREGVDPAGFPEWLPILRRHENAGLLTRAADGCYCLTARGREVCDAILEDLV